MQSTGQFRPMAVRVILLLAVLAATACPGLADEILFQDDFNFKLGEGWSWLREHPAAWRVRERGLEVRIEPGNMWGPANNASNVLVRTVPSTDGGPLEVSINVDNQPTEQYEQVDLVWYYDDSHMVKIGHELVDGKLSIVMGREENDRTRTIAIIPLAAAAVQLRMIVRENRVRGQFRAVGSAAWRDAGECDLPAHGPAKISLQCYQGPAGTEHWARLTEFRIRRLSQ
jgi:regulation of enolase protein 1 (concanavalin A-like superfamily)